jgi:hypothetical protein
MTFTPPFLVLMGLIGFWVVAVAAAIYWDRIVGWLA